MGKAQGVGERVLGVGIPVLNSVAREGLPEKPISPKGGRGRAVKMCSIPGTKSAGPGGRLAQLCWSGAKDDRAGPGGGVCVEGALGR